MKKTRVGVIGCGMISEIYMSNCRDRYTNLELVACADIIPEAAQRRAEQFGCCACTVEELLAREDVDVVLNLTVPAQHGPVCLQAIRAGKSVYTEKPLCIDMREGEQILKEAAEHGVLVGSAPDCFMGAGLQTVRKLLEDKVVGDPISFEAFMYCRGPEYFHPNPQFFYQKGAGPILDWGPYYASALVALLGPVKRVYSAGNSKKPVRTVLSEKSSKCGETFQVEVPTTVCSVLTTKEDVIGTLTLSFDMHYTYWDSQMPYMRIYCENGTIELPDLNRYDGPVRLRKGNGEFEEVPLVSDMSENCRGFALADMAASMESGRRYRADGNFALHISQILLAIQESAAVCQPVELTTKCVKPDAVTWELIQDVCQGASV